MVLDILKDRTLTYEQKVIALARFAENSVEPIAIAPEAREWFEREVISDMFEGNAPYRPRYIVPDYTRLMDQGCDFLRLCAPTTLQEAIHALLIMYKHVPSITTLPVYIGELDTLLEPFVTAADDGTFEQIKMFLIHIDRTITDSFCHANLSGKDTKVARMILKAERELENAIPNITVKVNEHTTDDFLLEAIQTSLKVAKPSFANDAMFRSDFEPNEYGIVSCYNGLPIGGGSYTLVRMNLAKLAQKGDSEESFIVRLETAVPLMLDYMDQRVSFLLNDTDFFSTHFLVKEGFIDIKKFTAMFGIVGLADAVNTVHDEFKFGHDDVSEAFGKRVIETLESLVNRHKNEMLYATDSRYVLHAQVGLDTDEGVSPGCRIPIHDEPAIHDHILKSAPYHSHFPSGIGDIFRFDETVRRNPMAIVDIIRGAFKSGLRYFSLYEDNADVVRITGYLVKKSDIEKLRRGEQVLNDAVVLGKGAVDNQKVLERKKREL
ncbi:MULTISPECIES: YjjI family glycine radical enzyme [unclassified Fusibacter]|uniref:YjjI family glycine radical enzyme n=1 Tax=unclassified Fusibacter TaxID=2624464 RepID=UPI0010132A9F|nr:MULTISPECIES: YjjI family glycine radical enzyme [unclassified Fusibacter]MCK8059389.1 YjjI family glycine radical enzyme [Fusibacter sp. A2]NPE21147.1 YjjI family glycine radical enzyme [Fusibacter sp. A1]RXV62416.1 YjjI family glycine radical enzyme [Fusibacter sp. A1]